MAVPFLNSITLNKNEVQDFKVYNIGTGNPTLSSGGDIGYFWTDTTGSKVLKWWDGSAVRTILDSASTTIVAADLSGGSAGSLPYQQGASDTTFLGIGTAGQVLKVNSGATAPEWTAQSNLSVGTATFLAGGTAGDIPVQSAAGTTGFLNIGANGRILTSNGSTPVWSATIPSSAVSGLAASATTDTTNASNISSGTLSLGRLSLANGQFYVGDASNNPAATAKTSIPLSGFGAATADVSMGTYKITNLGTPLSTDPDSTAATKGYVDSVAQGLDVKASCVVASTTNITLASPGSITIDGVSSATFTSGVTRILVKDQSAQAENGIYIWNGTGSAMTRSLDANTWDELVGAFTFVETGTANADSGWVCNVNAGGTLGTTAVTWTKFSQAGSYTAGNGMVLSGGVFHFAQDTNYTAGRIPFASGNTTIGFNANLFWDNSNNRLGIGTASPANKLEVQNSSDADILIKSTGANAALILDYADSYGFSVLRKAGNQTWSYGVIGDSSASAPFVFRYSSSNLMTLSSGGNLGLGVTPYGWSASIKAFDFGLGSLYSVTDTVFAHNAYVNTSGNWTYKTNAGASFLQVFAGAYKFHSVSAGTGTITWGDPKMTLDASGNLLVGTTTATSKFVVSSSGDTLATIIGGAANAKGISFYDASTNGCQIYSVSSDIRFFTTASGSSTERLRIPSSGEIQAIGQGSASAPIFSRTGDTNTGLYFPAADTLALAVGGSDAVYIDANRRVGIGTPSPATFLHVKATSSYDAVTVDAAASAYPVLFFATNGTNRVQQFVDFADNSFILRTIVASGLKFGTDSTTRLTISSTGQALFSTNGTASAPTIANADNPDTGLYWPTDADTLALAVGGSDAVYIDANRNVNIGAVSGAGYRLFVQSAGAPVAAINSTNASGPYVIFQSSGTNFGDIGSAKGITGLYNATDMALNVRSTGSMYFCVNDSAKMTLDASGNLGVGATSPASRFHTYLSDAGTNDFVRIATLQRATTGTAAVGFGQYLRFDLERSDGSNEISGFIGTKWSNATAGVTKGDLVFGGSDNGALTTTMTLEASGNLRVGAAAAAGVLTVTNSTTNTSIGLVNLSGYANTNTNSIDFYLDNSNSGVVTHGVIGCINTAATANRYGELFFKTANAAAPVTRIRIKAQGQLNLVPISADPAGPEAGDVYYNSTSNTLKWYGTAWNTLPRKVSAVGVGTGPSITVTHNFGTKDVIVQVRDSSDAQVLTDVSYATNSVTVTFASSQTLSNYTVTVIG